MIRPGYNAMWCNYNIFPDFNVVSCKPNNGQKQGGIWNLFVN